jgi:hypothetical protein
LGVDRRSRFLWGDRLSLCSVSAPWTDCSLPKKTKTHQVQTVYTEKLNFFDILNKMEALSTLKIDLFIASPPSICHPSLSSPFPHERPLSQSCFSLATLFSPISQSQSTTVAAAILPSLHFVLPNFTFFTITNVNHS